MMKQFLSENGKMAFFWCWDVYTFGCPSIHKIDEAFHICGVDALTDEKHLKRLGDFGTNHPWLPVGAGEKVCGWLFQA